MSRASPRSRCAGKHTAAEVEAGGFAKVEIAGERRTSGSLPSGATVRALGYSFEATGLKAGRNTVVFENAGKEPHHLVALPINPGKTMGLMGGASRSPVYLS